MDFHSSTFNVQRSMFDGGQGEQLHGPAVKRVVKHPIALTSIKRSAMHRPQGVLLTRLVMTLNGNIFLTGESSPSV